MSPSAIPIDAAATHVLRQSVLRPHQPIVEMDYGGDHSELTAHFGCFAEDGIVAVGSIYREARDGGSSDGWRVRGMATQPDQRGRGYGRATLEACLAYAAANGGGEVWCNARTPALSLYADAGFEVIGDEFELPDIGPHVVMVLRENKY